MDPLFSAGRAAGGKHRKALSIKNSQRVEQLNFQGAGFCSTRSQQVVCLEGRSVSAVCVHVNVPKAERLLIIQNT